MTANHWDWREQPFEIRDYLLEHQLIYTDLKTAGSSGDVDTRLFMKLKHAVIDHFNTRFEQGKEHEKSFWLIRQHEGVMGVKASVNWFRREIEEFLRRNGMLGSPYPKCYSDLVEAAYQETYGLGVISTWWKHRRHRDSQAARIIGTKVFFEIPGESKELQDIAYASEAEVLRVAKQLSLRSPTNVLNAHHPSLEIDMADGTRVTIVIPPWSVSPMIVFRHYTIRKITLEQIADKGTYPRELIPVLRGIAKGRGTSIICGPVKSGKSTLLSALIGERNGSDKMMILQKGFDELKVSRHYPRHQVMELLMTEENRSRIFDLVLRSDYEYIVVGEMRSMEAELFLKACERGLPGALTTYHTPDPGNIPSQLADLILDDHPAKSHTVQTERAAKHIHFAIVMEERSDRGKRLSKLTVFDWNPDTKRFFTHDLAVWNHRLQDWTYSARIPPRVMNVLESYAPMEARQMMTALHKLSSEKPAGKGGADLAS